MKGKNYYYSCVKPEESDAQTERFRALGARDGEIFIDTIGEKSSQRNNLRLLKQLALREGDTLTVSSLYCLSDLKKGLADELHWMRDNGIQLRIADIPLSVQEHDEKSQQFLSDLMFEVFDATIFKEREQRCQKQSADRQLHGHYFRCHNRTADHSQNQTGNSACKSFFLIAFHTAPPYSRFS